MVLSYFESGLQNTSTSKVPLVLCFSLIPSEYYDQGASADENLSNNVAANRLTTTECKGQMQMMLICISP